MRWFRAFLVGVALVVAAVALMFVFPDMEWNGGEDHFDTADEAAFIAWLALLLVGLPAIGVGVLGCVVRWVVERRMRPSN